MYSEPERGLDGHWRPKTLRTNPFDISEEEAGASLIRQNPDLKEFSIHVSISPETLVPLFIHNLSNLQGLLRSNSCPFNQHAGRVLLESPTRKERTSSKQAIFPS